MDNLRNEFGRFIKYKKDNFCIDCNKKISQRAKRCFSCAKKGKNNYMFGKENKWGNHTEESKKKMGRKGRKLSEESKRKISKNSSKFWLGKKLSKEHKNKIVMTRIKNDSYKHTMAQRIALSKKMSGKNGSNWKGGITPINKILRVSSKWKIWRELIFLRDNFTCQNPNCSYCNNKFGGTLHPHHIKPLSLYPELAFNVDNGITYCKDYHLKSNLHRNMQKEC